LLANDDLANFGAYPREVAGGKLKSGIRLHRVYFNAATGRYCCVRRERPR